MGPHYVCVKMVVNSNLFHFSIQFELCHEILFKLLSIFYKIFLKFSLKFKWDQEKYFWQFSTKKLMSGKHKFKEDQDEFLSCHWQWTDLRSHVDMSLLCFYFFRFSALAIQPQSRCLSGTAICTMSSIFASCGSGIACSALWKIIF